MWLHVMETIKEKCKNIEITFVFRCINANKSLKKDQYYIEYFRENMVGENVYRIYRKATLESN